MEIKKKKQMLLDELYAPYKKCIQCPLGTLGRTHVVFGDGNPDARIFFIGEGPGATEDAQGLPFVGKSGKLLNKAFLAASLKREDVFITSIVKCRPPQNRKPTNVEVKTCKNLLLLKQIQIVSPNIICTLGTTAFEGLLEKKIVISQERGTSIDFQGITIIPMYHPAYVVRNPKYFNTLVQDLIFAVKTSLI
jgi:uracil-DNA glycosylase family 4